MDVLADRVLELGPKPEAERPLSQFQADPRCRRHRLAVVRSRQRQRQHAVGRRHRGTRHRAGGAGKPAADRDLSSARRKNPASSPAPTSTNSAARPIPRAGRDRHRPRACGDRPPRSVEDPDRRRDPRLLPRRRPRSRARLPVADCDRRRALWFSGGDARPASRPRRHRALHASGQSDAGDDADADRQDHRRAPGKIARAGRCRGAGAACPQRREGRGVRPV